MRFKIELTKISVTKGWSDQEVNAQSNLCGKFWLNPNTKLHAPELGYSLYVYIYQFESHLLVCWIKGK